MCKDTFITYYIIFTLHLLHPFTYSQFHKPYRYPVYNGISVLRFYEMGDTLAFDTSRPHRFVITNVFARPNISTWFMSLKDFE